MDSGGNGMTPRELFKAGFIARCADEGLTPEGTYKRAEAAVKVAGLAEIAESAPILAAGTGLAAAGGLGYLGGNMLASAQSNPDAVANQQQSELVSQYQILAERARRRRAESAALLARPA